MDDYQKLLKRFLIPTLRRASYRWPMRNSALINARIERGIYLCANCSIPHPRKNVQIDHTVPVVPLEIATTPQSWDNYIERMFCPKEGYQILCLQCHELKSSVEVQTRKQNRQKLKDSVPKKKKVAKKKKA